MNIKNHKLVEAKFMKSPNYNDRPAAAEITAVIIHAISLPPNIFKGSYVEDFFLNKLNSSIDPYFDKIKELKVSAHLYIKRSGEIIQFVDFNKRAWHAGRSELNGKSNCNDFSIGIELEGSDFESFNKVQYQQLNSIISVLKTAYLKISKVTGHSDVSPGRKTDPGPFFEWNLVNG